MVQGLGVHGAEIPVQQYWYTRRLLTVLVVVVTNLAEQTDPAGNRAVDNRRHGAAGMEPFLVVPA